MSHILLFLLLGLSVMILAEPPLTIDHIKERLENSAQRLSIERLIESPDAKSYLNNYLTKNSPHIINLNEELTKMIHEWSPRLLALDPTCPYYFSKFNNISLPEEDRNLLSYLQAIESNQTTAYPFHNTLPKSYLNAIPLLSIFHCSELINSNSFFHNIELIIGPGQTELSLERQSNMFSQLYCVLNGWPHFILVDQTKQSTITYNAQTLLSQDNLADVKYFSTNLVPGDCLFVPPDWVTGAQLNNSISLLFTLKKIEKPSESTTNDEPLPCTPTSETTLDTVEFTIVDKFNMSDMGLLIYFYQYLNPPIFDIKYTRETFFDHFRQDRNVSKIIFKWTPDLISLIKNTLFDELDINNDETFTIDDYFDIKQTSTQRIQNSVYEILETLRQSVLKQFNEVNETIAKISKKFETEGLNENMNEALQDLLAALPESVKEKLQESNVNVEDVLYKLKHEKPKRPSINKERVRVDDASILFDQDQSEEMILDLGADQEEDIIAEPIIKEDELSHRTDL
ncbi:unnamed protein product [Rotaria sp. Silwood1]|nr:unnamed protein product [Rotaria sp. Silwood1]CAF3491240.1 unnamed protein product [Rotaria sp. Silwood1]CAF3547245.1 unnamed protein product [Rotaria sp. Silwood1]CAF4496437.1 unnamed protein product [Rotaria sp. Silwood1]CAF4588031.1 unnamed protein product [Rotaria sp. Silwood1]